MVRRKTRFVNMLFNPSAWCKLLIERKRNACNTKYIATIITAHHRKHAGIGRRIFGQIQNASSQIIPKLQVTDISLKRSLRGALVALDVEVQVGWVKSFKGSNESIRVAKI